MVAKYKKTCKKMFFDLKLTTLNSKSRPISLAIVSDCGKKFYCEFNENNEEILIDSFNYKFFDNLFIKEEKTYLRQENTIIKGNNEEIKEALKKWICQFKKCKFIGHYTPYKWVVFCEIFGGNKFLPKNIIKFPHEINQMSLMNGLESKIEDFFENRNLNNPIITSLCVKELYIEIQSIKNKNRFYVYKYIDLDRNPFYIGKGSGRRVLFHLSQAVNNNKKIENLHKTNKIKNILNLVSVDAFIYNHIIIIEDYMDEKSALELEKSLILKYGRLNIGTGLLTNITEGGDFKIGNYQKSDAHKMKISITLKAKKKNEVSRVKQSKSMDGKNNPMYNQNHTEEAKNKIRLANSKPIILNGVSYNSITEASKLLLTSRTTITRLLKKMNYANMKIINLKR